MRRPKNSYTGKNLEKGLRDSLGVDKGKARAAASNNQTQPHGVLERTWK